MVVMNVGPDKAESKKMGEGRKGARARTASESRGFVQWRLGKGDVGC